MENNKETADQFIQELKDSNAYCLCANCLAGHFVRYADKFKKDQQLSDITTLLPPNSFFIEWTKKHGWKYLGEGIWSHGAQRKDTKELYIKFLKED